MSDLTMQEIDNWRSALAPLAPEYQLYVDLLHAAARRGVEADAQPVAQPVSDERIEQIYDETAGAMGDDYAHAGWLAFARALLREAQPEGTFALNVKHPDCHRAADAFWQYWRENGETHKHGYYESTWGGINAAIRLVGVIPHQYAAPKGTR